MDSLLTKLHINTWNKERSCVSAIHYIILQQQQWGKQLSQFRKRGFHVIQGANANDGYFWFDASSDGYTGAKLGKEGRGRKGGRESECSCREFCNFPKTIYLIAQSFFWGIYLIQTKEMKQIWQQHQFWRKASLIYSLLFSSSSWLTTYIMKETQ